MHTNDVFVIRLKLFHWNNKKAEYFVYFMQIGQMEEGRGGPTKKHLEYFSDVKVIQDMKLTYIYIYATLYAGPY